MRATKYSIFSVCKFEKAKFDEKMSHKMRAAVESAIAEYDDAVELQDKQHFAVVAIERMRMYLQSEPRRRSVFADDDDDSTFGSTVVTPLSPNGAGGIVEIFSTKNLPIAITDRRPFKYETITYPTVQHAFQAQKLPADERINVASMSLWEALDAGRKASIDINAWDANKSKLMYRLMKEQAKHHDTMMDALIQHRNVNIVVEDVYDSFWPTVLPKMYQRLGESFAQALAANATADGSADTCASSSTKKHKEPKEREEADESTQSGASSAKRLRKE